uniref:Proteasome subunit beta n=1 Tax=Rhodosorus marinus TaxID=101924 RepID=A0A7S0BEU4_9RHOD|mmetsp:Transcript_13539/g.19514  ORF Transcript_13539/g.19514 Transcript_13539/m.19514 type:complete len:206 (+) Transcript_13539:190-807(+)
MASILEYNGGTVVAMSGDGCVAIASDTRLGQQYQTIAMDVPRIFKMHDRLFLGLTGLYTDTQTLHNLFKFKLSMYKMREGREISPETFANLVSSTLYEKRFGPYFTEPIVVGLDKDNKPYLCGMDLLGALACEPDFVTLGTSTEMLLGACETFYRENMSEGQLFEVVSQTLMMATDRDCLSGWGGVVHIISKDGITTKTLKTRQD